MAKTHHTTSKRGLLGWALYDWANSPFTTLVITFVFATYFQQAVVGDAVRGQAMWSTAMALAGLAIAVIAPFLGAVADASGARKPWIVSLTLLCAACTAGLWFVEPDPSFIWVALVLVILANLGFEFGFVFSNALLPDIAPPDRIGRLSGWSWGLGFIGGLVALVLALSVLIQPEVPPFALDADSAEHVRITGPLVALWLLVFALPLFLWTPDRPSTGIPLGRAVAQGLRETGATLKSLPARRDLFRFLLANLLYNNGLLTLFGLGGVYAAGVFGMSLAEVIQFGIALNVTAGLGAFSFAFLDDRIGSKPTILIALVGLVLASVTAVAAPDRLWLWVAGLAIGLFVGPVQAASRSLMARLSPVEASASHFGLFALSGRATAFLGPAFVALATALSGSQRFGMATIVIFLVAGALVLLTVREPVRAETK